jgi:hypothetical protein
MEAMPFQSHRIASAQAGRTHEQHHRAQAYPQVGNQYETASRVSVSLGRSTISDYTVLP